MVVWERDQDAVLLNGVLTTTNVDFQARRLDAGGNLLGSEIHVGGRVSTDLAIGLPITLPLPTVPFSTAATSPSVAIDNDGNFVVVWAATTATGVVGPFHSPFIESIDSRSVYARRFNASGLPRDLTPVLVDRMTIAENYDRADRISGRIAPTIAMTPSGDFAVSWIRPNSVAANIALVIRRYSADGKPTSAVITVDSGLVNASSITLSSSGQLAMTWRKDLDIIARVYGADGAALSGPIAVSPDNDGEQSNPLIAGDASGNFVINWSRDQPVEDLFGQRFAGY